MRKFGIDAPDFFAFQLEDDDTIYKIPIAGSMPVKELMKMSKAAGGENLFIAQLEMLNKYMGDVVFDLPASTVGEILRAWDAESNGRGASVGES